MDIILQMGVGLDARSLNMTNMEVKEIAEMLHDYYEDFSRLEGWKTQESCRVKFDDLPEANKRVMLRTARCIHTITRIKLEKEQHRVAREIMDIINYQRDNGNLHPDKGFSAALCLSDIIKKLKEYGVK